MISLEGQQTWMVLENSIGQLKIAGMSGIPYGLDLLACARISDAFGFETDMVMRLMPFAEMGLVKGLAKTREEKG